jgi:hypothetical protein
VADIVGLEEAAGMINHRRSASYVSVWCELLLSNIRMIDSITKKLSVYGHWHRTWQELDGRGMRLAILSMRVKRMAVDEKFHRRENF